MPVGELPTKPPQGTEIVYCSFVVEGLPHFKMNNLEMLTAREQLMEDIDCIITDYFAQFDVNYDEELVRILCDAVCRNFPAN